MPRALLVVVRIYEWMRVILQAFLFPEACVVCGNWTANRDFSPLCQQCLESIPPMNSPVCALCGLPVAIPFPPWTEICQQCRIKESLVVRSWGPYFGTLRVVIQAYKFRFRRRLCAPLSDLLVKAFKKYYSEEEFDWIVPVPLHPDRKRQRGFDQTYLLARNLSKAVQIPIFRGVRRVKSTRPQSGLSIQQRRLNLRSAFEVRSPRPLQGDRLLLVDDIYTTGATAASLAQSMQKVSAVDRIAVLTVARVLREVWN